MSLIAELQRRSVFKVGAAYLVVGWLVIQVAATVAPQMALPDWAPRLITLCVLLGFPIALVLAWVFDLTPEGVKIDAQGVGTKRLFMIAAVLAALAIGWFMGGMGGPRDAAPAGEGAPAETAYLAPLGDKSTAVLPFVNMSSDKENEYFSDGLTETLLHKLAQVSSIKVAARTSSFAFKGKQDDIRAIGRQLGVATVVEGSVQRAGDTLRITAQLVRTADGSHIWSRNYDRKLADIFAIQDEIAGAVAEALVGALAPEAKAAIAQGGTQDLVAYDLYTKALQQNAISSFESLGQAEILLTQALERDPKFVDAMVALGTVWSGMSGTGMFGAPELERRMAPLLDRLHALAPEHGMLLAFRAEQARRRGDAAGARALFERAVEVAPNNAELRNMNGLDLGRHAADLPGALVQLDRALELDPLNSETHQNRAFNLRTQRRMDEAEAAARRAIELNPRVPTAHTLLGDMAGTRGDLAGMAIWYMKAHRIDPLDHEIAAEIGSILQDLGEEAAADAWLAEAERRSPGTLWVPAYRVLMRHARGQHAQAVDGALAIANRHDEERRNNWSSAQAAACDSALLIGRLPELRATLVKARMVPAELTPAGLNALVSSTYPLDHVIGHMARQPACFFDAGEAGKPQRAQARRTLDTLRGDAWRRLSFTTVLAGYLDEDLAAQREAIKAQQVASDSPRAMRESARLVSQLAFRGLANDPWMVARIAEARTAAAAQRAELPRRLAAEGLSLLPAAVASPTKLP